SWIKSVKEDLRRIPDKGMGYGALRYLHPDEAVRERLSEQNWEIEFNYLGQLDNVLMSEGPLQIAEENTGASSAAENSRPLRMMINVWVRAGQLEVNWQYAEQVYERATISHLATAYLQHLRTIIKDCMAVQTRELTPSDFGLQDHLSPEGLDRFLDADPNRRANLEALYPLSPLQEGLLFHSLLAEQGGAYINQFSCELRDLQEDYFYQSWKWLQEKHSVLRTCFYADDFAIPLQGQYASADLPISHYDYRAYDEQKQAERLNLFLKTDREKAFDLRQAPLFRVSLIRLSNSVHRMVWTFHHLINDGWSTPVIIGELLNSYELLKQGQTLAAPVKDQYEDYIRFIRSTKRTKATAFWQKYLQTIENPSLLPFSQMEGQRNQGGASIGIHQWQLSPEKGAALNAFAHKHHLTINTIVQGVWAYLLARYTGQNQAVYGVTVSGRPAALSDAASRVGLYINTIPLSAEMRWNQSPVEWLQQIQLGHSQAREYQFLSLKEIQATNPLKGDWFDSILVFENYPIGEGIIEEHQALASDVQIEERTNYLLTLSASFQSTLDIHFIYNDEWLDAHYVEAISGHFEQVLDQLVQETAPQLSDLQILKATERAQLLHQFNATQADYPADSTIIDLFEEQVRRQPDAVALRMSSRALTYAELDGQINQLAHYLQAQGLRPNSCVGVCMHRSIEMIIGIYAIIKTGAAYLPIAPNHPAKRMDYLIEDSQLTCILSDWDNDLVSPTSRSVNWLNIHSLQLDHLPNHRPAVAISPDDLLYVLYTSGSTGQPKACAVNHRSLVNHNHWMWQYLGMTKAAVVLQRTNYVFDASIWELFMPLCYGACLQLCDEESAFDPTRLLALIQKTGVNVIQFVPSILNTFLQHVASLEAVDLSMVSRVCCGGEALSKNTLAQFKKYFDAPLYNLYGPTEATIDVAAWEATRHWEAGQLIAIGRPVNNAQLYVLDANQDLLPIGVKGQLYVGGLPLSRAYLNRPELSAQKFISAPWDASQRLYQTGDWAKYLPDGSLLCLGRMDEQVKIRGHRIELGEIEKVLSQNEAFIQTVVMTHPGPTGDLQLVAYVLPRKAWEEKRAKEQVAQFLPGYMVPDIWISMETMPLTPNGKVDKRRLPIPDLAQQMTHNYEAPQTAEEEQMVTIWQDLLGLKKVGRSSHFFTLGGHSLLAVRLMAAIRKTFGVAISLKVIFEYPVLADLSAYIHQQDQIGKEPGLLSVQRPEQIPLSFAQERLWFIHQLEGSVHYHIPMYIRMQGELDVTTLGLAFRYLIERHEILRTIYIEQEGQVHQKIRTSTDWSLSIVDHRGRSKEQKDHWFLETSNQAFDLAMDYPIRVHLIKEEETHVLMVLIHHIAFDAWSSAIFIDELVQVYKALKSGVALKLPALEVQYADFAIWQRQRTNDQTFRDQLEWWTQQLEGVRPQVLVRDFPYPDHISKQGAKVPFTIDATTTHQLNQLSKEAGATLFMTLSAALKILLYRYSGQADICIGTTTAHREQSELESLIGFFVNTLALRSDLSGQPSFMDLLQRIKTGTIEAFQHQEVPFERIVERVDPHRSLQETPLFQVLFELQNTPAAQDFDLEDLHLMLEEEQQVLAKFDLRLVMTETEEGLNGELVYRSDLFHAQTIERFARYFKVLLHSICADPMKNIDELKLLSATERQHLRQAPSAMPAVDHSLLELFNQKVAQHPDRPAILYKEQTLSYQELDDLSNQLARFIQAKQVAADQLVAICMERSPWLMIALLGVLKSGAAYLPIDPASPSHRVDRMLQKSKAKLLLIEEKRLNTWEVRPTLPIVFVENLEAQIQRYPSAPLNLSPAPHQLAYTIFTSGSTGEPKGVAIETQNLSHYLQWALENYQLEDPITMPLYTGISFDISVTALYLPLLSGGQVIIYPPSSEKDRFSLLEVIADNKVNTIKLTPSHLRLLEDTPLANRQIQQLIVGGEALSTALAMKMKTLWPAVQLYNEYGPTEATVGCICHRFDAHTDWQEQVPIGKAIDRMQAYVLDAQQQLVPRGMIGELYLAGAGLARGYLHAPELTQAQFIDHPFQAGERLYKTGDWVRENFLGDLAFWGRKDDQVKIRAHRIELGEIEMQLSGHPAIRDCAVIATKGADQQALLAAYLVPQASIELSSIQAYLRERLPDYMIPQQWMELEALPLSHTGKLDRKALAGLGAELKVQEYQAPQTLTEKHLAQIWSELLEVEEVGLQDQFFDLGGHSLLAIRVLAALQKEMEVEISIDAIFSHTTLEALAAHIDQQSTGLAHQPLSKMDRGAKVPLSYAQERLWFIDQLEGSIAYHIPMVLELKGPLDQEALRQAFQQLIQRHEVLRTVYREEGGKAYQEILPADQWQMQIAKSSSSKTTASLDRFTNEAFDLSTDYVLRAMLTEVGQGHYTLAIVIHHIATDGWSMSIFINELVALYQAELMNLPVALEPLPIQYADYAIWQRQQLDAESLSQQLAWWEEELKGIEALSLPLDFPRPAVRSSRGASMDAFIDAHTIAALEALGQSQGATLFMTALAAFKVLLHRYSSQTDICVGSPVANRHQKDTEPLIGFFLNSLPLRTDLSGDPSFEQLLAQVKETTLNAYAHQTVPFEQIVDRVDPLRDMSRSPLFQHLFVLQNVPEAAAIDLADLQIQPQAQELEQVKHDLTFMLSPVDDGLVLTIKYCIDLYREESVRRMQSHFIHLLKSIIAAPQKAISTLRFIPEAEKTQLLKGFNQTSLPVPTNETIVSIFEKYVKKHPEQSALIYGDQVWTYRTLNAKANQLARLLRKKYKVQPGTLVALMLDRSEWMLVGILGVLKAGGAYVPIDLAFPEDRRSYILNDAQPAVVLVSEAAEEQWPCPHEVLTEELLSQESAYRNLSRIAQPKDIVYVIHTSGSTGRPKGVLIEHLALINYVKGIEQVTALSPGDHYVTLTDISTDAGNTAIFGSLCLGGTLHLIAKELLEEPEAFFAYSEKYPIALIKFTPSLLTVMINECPTAHLHFKNLLIGGEAMSWDLYRKVRRRFRGQHLLNHYGPTEATIGVLVNPFSTLHMASFSPPIGKPIANTQVYILDEQREVVPIGAVGRIFIGGGNLARAYLNLPERSQERFIPHPFSTDASARLYDTGDLGRWLPDGHVAFLGRKDDQVKIRGYRIELGEIEHNLMAYPDMKQCALQLMEDASGNKRLVAYVVTKGSYHQKALQDFLSGRLPSYMQPSLWIPMEQMPLTANNKVDKKALPAPDWNAAVVQNHYEAPQSKIEIHLAQIWQQLLGVAQVGRTDNFFELGGDSIISIQVVSRAKRMGYTLRPRDLFEYQTLAALAQKASSISAETDAEQGL
ncbi:MAG: amino acid adenylation domain-containing protein, partial [Bacteroidota bacterium]